MPSTYNRLKEKKYKNQLSTKDRVIETNLRTENLSALAGLCLTTPSRIRCTDSTVAVCGDVDSKLIDARGNGGLIPVKPQNK